MTERLVERIRREESAGLHFHSSFWKHVALEAATALSDLGKALDDVRGYIWQDYQHALACEEDPEELKWSRPGPDKLRTKAILDILDSAQPPSEASERSGT